MIGIFKNGIQVSTTLQNYAHINILKWLIVKKTEKYLDVVSNDKHRQGLCR